MHTKEPREDPLVEMGYEIRDVDFPKFRMAAIFFFGFAGVCAIIGWFMYMNRFWVFAVTPPQSEVGMKHAMPGPEYPLLQDNMTSKMDIADLRQRETTRMTSTGMNPDGSVHIPVDRAMGLIAERGIPPTNHTVPAVTRANTVGPTLLSPPTPQPYGTPNPGTEPPATTEPGEVPNTSGVTPSPTMPPGNGTSTGTGAGLTTGTAPTSAGATGGASTTGK